MYLDALGRVGAAAELDFWVKQLNSGVSQGQVAAMLEQSPEARTRLVRTWYLTYLGRQAMNNEEQPFVNLLLQGQAEEAVLAGVLGVAGLLIWEQSLVTAQDLSQIKRAFDMNGWVGILYFVTTAVAIYWK